MVKVGAVVSTAAARALVVLLWLVAAGATVWFYGPAVAAAVFVVALPSALTLMLRVLDLGTPVDLHY